MKDIGRFLNLQQRRDEHSLSQNIASKLRSIISALIGKQMLERYNTYLLEYGIRNSQMIVLFAHLFLKKYAVKPAVCL